jgi:hypothetical protein
MVSTRRQQENKRKSRDRPPATATSPKASSASSDEESNLSDLSDSNRSGRTPSSNVSAFGLALHIQKQLIADILAGGGLELISLKQLCNSKQDIYGKIGSPTRRQIQNKVHIWKKLAPVEFRKVVSEINPNTLYPLLPSPSPNQHQSPLLRKQSPLPQKRVATPARLFSPSSMSKSSSRRRSSNNDDNHYGMFVWLVATWYIVVPLDFLTFVFLLLLLLPHRSH